MKRLIYAAKRNPVEDMSVRREFDKLWKRVGKDPDEFLYTLDIAYGNSELPSSLDMDYDELMRLANLYIDYKQGPVVNAGGYSFSVEDSDAAVEQLANSMSKIPVIVEHCYEPKVHRDYTEIRYSIFLENDPANYTVFTIELYPNYTELTVEDKNTISHAVKNIISAHNVVTAFMKKYSGLVDEFYSKCTDIPRSEYQEHVRCYAGDGIEFKAPWIELIAESLYNKGYIDNINIPEAEEFIKSLFASYGFDHMNLNIGIIIFGKYL